MNDAVTTTRRERREMTFNADTQMVSIEGIGQFDASKIPEAGRLELIGVGLITILSRVKSPTETYAEMLSGKWGRRAEKQPKPLTDWQRAIIQVKSDDLIDAKRKGGEKITTETRAAAAAQADAWVRGLSSDQVTALKQVAAVKTAHGKLTGVQMSLDDALRAPVPVAGDPVAESESETEEV